MSDSKMRVRVTVPFEDLPDTAYATGFVKRSLGTDFKQEANGSETVLEFRRETLGQVRRLLAGKTYDEIEITDIRF